jgi:hypothetical protein
LLKTLASLLIEMSTLILIVLNVLCLPSIAEFRIFPEHIFTMDVGLICQVGLERLKLNAIISIWEEDVGKTLFNILFFCYSKQG